MGQTVFPRMNVMIDIFCIDSVDLWGPRGNRKIQNEKLFPTVGLELTSLIFVGRGSTDWVSRAWWKTLLLKWTLTNMNFGYQWIHWYKYKAWWSLSICCGIQVMQCVTYWNISINSKKTQKSCVCFQHAKQDQTFFLIWSRHGQTTLHRTFV